MILRTLSFFLLLVVMCSASTVWGDPHPQSQLPGTDAIFFGPQRPLLLRFIVASPEANDGNALDQTVSKLFGMLDVDQDGLLSSKERKLLPTPRMLNAFGLNVSAKRSGNQLLQQGPRTSVKSTADLKAYLQRLGLDALTVAQKKQGEDPDRLQPGQLLFDGLDQNHDRLLSASELASAVQSLRKVDLNQDESWSLEELIVSLAHVDDPEKVRTGTPAARADAAIVPVSAFSPLQFGSECLRRYSNFSLKSQPKMNAGAESSSITGLRALDLDGDEKLSSEEWSKFLSTTSPELFVILDFQSDIAKLTILDQQGQPSPQSGKPQAELTFAPFVILLELVDHSAAPSDGKIKEAFTRLDRDKNDYIDRNEAGQMQGFDFFDLDSDENGQVFLDEFTAGYKPLALLAAMRTQIETNESGFDLFKSISQEKDVLSLRTLGNLYEAMKAWDRDQDGGISQQELPRQIRLVLRQGSWLNPTGEEARQNVRFDATAAGRIQRRGRSDSWFTSMDRNGDGELSQREFLGEAELFKKLDANQDGLIDATEAEAVR